MLASDIMDSSAGYLNDTAKTLYTYTAQLPYLKLANKALEKLLLVFGAEVQRVKSSVLVLPAGSTSMVVNASTGQINLPTDFLLPIGLKERNSGATEQPWIPIVEQTWEPDITQTNDLRYYAFRNNGIYFVGALVDKDILMEYERQLAIITSENTPEDFILAENYLAARTAEYCARLVGMNSGFADEIKVNYLDPAEDDLMRILTNNQQGTPKRRLRYTAKRYETIY